MAFAIGAPHPAFKHWALLRAPALRDFETLLTARYIGVMCGRITQKSNPKSPRSQDRDAGRNRCRGAAALYNGAPSQEQG